MLKTAVYMSGEYYLDHVKKSVTFIFDPVGRSLGTGFFVGIQLEHGGGDAVYFVTAKHVLSPSEIFPPPNYYDSLYIRLNLIGGTAERIGLPLSMEPILTHEDENIDLAAIPLYPPQDRYDYLYIPQNYFTDDNILKKKNIREGSNVFFAGLFSELAKNNTNYPVVRFGKIALMTNEKIEINKEGESTRRAHFYVVECQSLGGFSGSPVFFEFQRITPNQTFISPEIYLGGVMKGHYNDVLPVSNGMRKLNAALALVTPCYLLNELLHTKKAKEQREELSRKIL
jgi:hypothetical protein